MGNLIQYKRLLWIFLSIMVITDGSIIEQNLTGSNSDKQHKEMSEAVSNTFASEQNQLDYPVFDDLLNEIVSMEQEERTLKNMHRLLKVIDAEYSDPELIYLKKKSWKLPIKTLGWYAEKNRKSNAPQKMISELTDLLDSVNIRSG